MGHCCVTPWSFGQEDVELKDRWGITTNFREQFIIGDHGDSNVKVFDSSHKFMADFCPPTESVNEKSYIRDVATDKNDTHLCAHIEEA